MHKTPAIESLPNRQLRIQMQVGLGEIARLSRLATGRDASVFADDFLRSQASLRDAIEGRRILVIGGSGTIGAATTAIVADFKPRMLHVVDQNENSLAELVRDLRSRPQGLAVGEFRSFPVDFGAPVMRRVLDLGPYDAVLNFAALKHVRSERDLPSLLQMLDTNLLKNQALMKELAARDFHGRYFCVSTDKAANPVSLMGVSKRLMEHLILSNAVVLDFKGKVNTARFANVAFSDGSLLHSFIRRFEKRQPIAVPTDTRRYFVSPRESGEVCAIAAFCAPPRTIVVPNFISAIELKLLSEVAADFVRAHGLKPSFYTQEDVARDVIESELARGYYPILQTPLDTSGEKPYEEFVGRGELAMDIGYKAIAAVTYAEADRPALTHLFRMIEAAVTGAEDASKLGLVAFISTLVPEFVHKETGRYLDERV